MNFDNARRLMIENQIRPNQITDPLLLDVMNRIPRERFLPERLHGVAYVDEDLPLGGGRYLMEPLVVAQVLQAAAIDGDDVVLEIGCGPGYMTAIIAHMASVVVALDEEARFVEATSSTLAELDLSTATIMQAPFAEGCPAQAPYDVIVFGGAVTAVPDAILEQLAEGGRLVAVIVGDHGIGKGTLFVRSAGVTSHRVVFDAATPLLPGFAAKPGFVF